MRFIALLVALLWAGAPAADPGVGEWQNLGGSQRLTGGQSTWLIIDGDAVANSELLHVGSQLADLCFDSLEGSESLGTATIEVRRVVDASTPTNANSVQITLPTEVINGTDCQVLTFGSYWVEVTANPGAGTTARVHVTGR